MEALKVDNAKSLVNNSQAEQEHCWLVDPLGTKTSFSRSEVMLR